MTTLTLNLSQHELVLLTRAVDLLQRQPAIADNMHNAVTLDCLYCRLVEALAPTEPVETTYLVGEQPFTCPECGARTMPVKQGWEWCRAHGFYSVEDDPEIDADHQDGDDEEGQDGEA